MQLARKTAAAVGGLARVSKCTTDTAATTYSYDLTLARGIMATQFTANCNVQ
jgi:hypothetical protein